MTDVEASTGGCVWPVFSREPTLTWRRGCDAAGWYWIGWAEEVVIVCPAGEETTISAWDGPDMAYIVVDLTCRADVDDGSGRGVRDRGVTLDDLLYYLALFGAGDTRADLDGDGGVTAADLAVYLEHFNRGC